MQKWLQLCLYNCAAIVVFFGFRFLVRPFWRRLKLALQRELGITALPHTIINELTDRDLRRARARDEAPVLACVTVLCQTVDVSSSRAEPKTELTCCGAEEFIRPGESKNIPIDAHRLVGKFTYFVSGHPNLVITAFNIGNHHTQSDTAGKKFGVWSGACEVGNRMYVRVEYRREGSRLL